MKFPQLFVAALSAVIFVSCASSYKAINPQTLNYVTTTQDQNFVLAYKYGVLQGKYAKKETKKGLKVIAVKMENKSGRDLVFAKDVKLAYSNKNEVVLADQKFVYNELKQGSAIYLLYLLLTPTKFTTNSNGRETSSTPIGYALGPGIAFGNMLVASTANGNFKKELEKYAVEGTVIKNGETKYGLIGIHSNSFESVNVVLEQVVAAK